MGGHPTVSLAALGVSPCRRGVGRCKSGVAGGSVQGDEHADAEPDGEQPQHRGQRGEESHAENTSPSLTDTATGGSGRGAGPPRTLPVAASKRLPWHGQLMAPSATLSTTHPWWVQTEENAWTSDPLRVSTTAGLSRTMPP